MSFLICYGMNLSCSQMDENQYASAKKMHIKSILLSEYDDIIILLSLLINE